MFSAVVGPLKITSSGSVISAIAAINRCSWPSDILMGEACFDAIRLG